jgi:hypothetical protein
MDRKKALPQGSIAAEAGIPDVQPNLEQEGEIGPRQKA